MQPDEQPDSGAGETYSTGRRIKRALARRFPRARWVYNWLRIQAPHHIRQLLALFSPRRSVATWRWLAGLTKAFLFRRREPRLTVGIEIEALWEPLTGVGWYLHRLLQSIADRQDIVVRLYGPTVVDSPDRVEPHVPLPTGIALDWVQHQVPDGLILERGILIRWLRRLEPILIAADRNDVLFGPN